MLAPGPEPSPFVLEWVPRVAATLPVPRRALDVAMGRGRHVSPLVRAGFSTFGVDRSWEVVRMAAGDALARGERLRAFCADMTQHPMPPRWFHLVLVSRYLDRARMPAIKAAVTPGGYVMYETFTRHQLLRGRGPTSPDHLLEPGELETHFGDFEIIFADECTAPDALARIVARRRVERSTATGDRWLAR